MTGAEPVVVTESEWASYADALETGEDHPLDAVVADRAIVVVNESLPVAFDPELGRPACVLVAAGMGASTEAAKRFPVESWLLSPTPGMGVYRTTPEQLDAIVASVKRDGLDA